MDDLMRSMLLREIGRATRALLRAERLLAARREQYEAALRQWQAAQVDSGDDRRIEARERADAILSRCRGHRKDAA